MDNSRIGAVILTLVAVGVFLFLIPWNGHPPLHPVTSRPSSDAEAARMVEVVPGTSLLGTPSASATHTQTMVREKRIIVADAGRVDVASHLSTSSLLMAIQPDDGGTITDDTQLLGALKELNQGTWPKDPWTCRKAMLFVIHTLRFDLPPKWPTSTKSDGFVKDVFIVTLQTHELAPLATKLLAAPPAPAPSTIP